MSSHHLKGSDIVILVYDVSRGYDENGLSYWIGEIENYAKHNNIIVVGNKIDLVEDSKMQ
jgi:GTPase SAR1 family protein